MELRTIESLTSEEKKKKKKKKEKAIRFKRIR